MPALSRFFGLVVFMYHGDHEPPPFHVRYAGKEARFLIPSLALASGELPPRARGMVVEWAMQHQRELRENWELARAHLPLRPIAPLE